MNIYKNKFMSRFGLMHMIATNICNWLKVLILETSHEIREMTAGNASGHHVSLIPIYRNGSDDGHGHTNHPRVEGIIKVLSTFF